MQEKELIKKLGMETLYSAKGHFKACDIRRNLVTITIWACVLLNVLGLFDFNALTGKIFSGIGIFGTVALLIWNEGEGKNYRSQNKQVAEAYLALHKKLRLCYFSSTCSNEEITQLSNEVIALDQSQKPDIPWMARKRAKKAIENEDPETDNWFL